MGHCCAMERVIKKSLLASGLILFEGMLSADGAVKANHAKAKSRGNRDIKVEAKDAVQLDAKADSNDAKVDGESLIKKNDCLSCHSVKNKIVGPAYTEVAKKYKGKKGGSGNGARFLWRPIPIFQTQKLKPWWSGC